MNLYLVKLQYTGMLQDRPLEHYVVADGAEAAYQIVLEARTQGEWDKGEDHGLQSVTLVAVTGPHRVGGGPVLHTQEKT